MPAKVNRPIKNLGNNRYFVKKPANWPGKSYIGNRYVYNYQKEAYDRTGRLPKRDEVTHHEGNRKVKSAWYQSRSKHYSGHGKPYARKGKSLTTLFKNRSPKRPRSVKSRKT